MAYLLMLIVMTYNCWFLISTVTGAGIGYFVFGQMLVKINLKNCKIIQDTFCGTSPPGKIITILIRTNQFGNIALELT